MRQRHSVFAILILAIFVSACATAPHSALPAEAKGRITSTDVMLGLRQSEIYVFVPNSQVAAAAGGGLIPALIDVAVNSVRTSKAETAVKPLRNVLVDVDFDSMLKNDIHAALTQTGWMHVNDVRVIKDVSKEGLDRAYAGSRAQAVLVANADYQLSNDADVFTVKIVAQLYSKDPALVGLKQGAKASQSLDPKNALYRNTLTFESRIAGATSDRDANIALLSREQGAAMRSLLKMGSAKISNMLAADLEPAESTGLVSLTDPEGNIARASDGTLKFTATGAK